MEIKWKEREKKYDTIFVTCFFVQLLESNSSKTTADTRKTVRLFVSSQHMLCSTWRLPFCFNSVPLLNVFYACLQYLNHEWWHQSIVITDNIIKGMMKRKGKKVKVSASMHAQCTNTRNVLSPIMYKVHFTIPTLSTRNTSKLYAKYCSFLVSGFDISFVNLIW